MTTASLNASPSSRPPAQHGACTRKHAPPRPRAPLAPRGRPRHERRYAATTTLHRATARQRGLEALLEKLHTQQRSVRIGNVRVCRI